MTNINEQAHVAPTAYLGAADDVSHTSTSSSGQPAAKEMASAAASETSTVAHTAVDAGKDVAKEAKVQVAVVAGQAKDQMANVVNQAKSELKTQADTRAEQVAAGLQTFADQLGALTDGRPESAGHVGALVGDAQQRVQAYAQTIQTRGPQAVLDDLTQLARKRPMMFLFGAVAAGLAAGRLARATAAVHSDESGDSDAYPSAPAPSLTALGGANGIVYGSNPL